MPGFAVDSSQGGAWLPEHGEYVFTDSATWPESAGCWLAVFWFLVVFVWLEVLWDVLGTSIDPDGLWKSETRL